MADDNKDDQPPTGPTVLTGATPQPQRAEVQPEPQIELQPLEPPLNWHSTALEVGSDLSDVS
jgi:hypothetical protein